MLSPAFCYKKCEAISGGGGEDATKMNFWHCESRLAPPTEIIGADYQGGCAAPSTYAGAALALPKLPENQAAEIAVQPPPNLPCASVAAPERLNCAAKLMEMGALIYRRIRWRLRGAPREI
jgi:hypothetical protein